jgi:hypothetical protein
MSEASKESCPTPGAAGSPDKTGSATVASGYDLAASEDICRALRSKNHVEVVPYDGVEYSKTYKLSPDSRVQLRRALSAEAWRDFFTEQQDSKTGQKNLCTVDSINNWTHLEFDFLGYVLPPDVLAEEKTALPQGEEWSTQVRFQQTKPEQQWRQRKALGSNTDSPALEGRQVAIFEITQSAHVFYKLAQLEVRLAYYAHRRALKSECQESLDCVAFGGVHVPRGTRGLIESVLESDDFPFKRIQQLCLDGKFYIVSTPPSTLPRLSMFGIQSPPEVWGTNGRRETALSIPSKFVTAYRLTGLHICCRALNSKQVALSRQLK